MQPKDVKALKNVIADYLLKALLAFNGNRTKTAVALKISRRCLLNKLEVLAGEGYHVPPTERFFNEKYIDKKAS